MKVLMFQSRSAPLVESGLKRQTIRPKRKHPIRPGDTLSLRTWSGKPYRSKQRVIRPATSCNSVRGVAIFPNRDKTEACMLVDGYNWTDHESMAKADGFANWKDMWTWFANTHGLPFEGDLITWVV